MHVCVYECVYVGMYECISVCVGMYEFIIFAVHLSMVVCTHVYV